MRTVMSKDGTTIAFDQLGDGPATILIGGALQHRAMDPETAHLATLLAQHFTVIHYDRRGRGDSGDTQPYAVEREIEDLQALINHAGGSAYVFGMSSGAALALQAARKLGDKVKKLAMYEVPYNDDDAAKQAWKEYIQHLTELLAGGHRGDAVALFMKLTGMPTDQIEDMRQASIWPMLEAVAPTLAYDHTAILGVDISVPTKQAASIAVPTLVLNGDASYGFMHVTATRLAKAIPNAEHRTVEGQTHHVAPDVLAPVLVQFFA